MRLLSVLVVLIAGQISPGVAQDSNSSPSSTFCTHRRDGLYPDPTSCTQFIHCHQSGQTAIKKCPKGTRYDRSIKVCNWARSVTCSTSQPILKIVPSEPHGLAVTVINSSTIEIQWNTPSKYSKPLLNYRITVSRSASLSVQTILYTLDPTTRSFVVTGLMPGTRYGVSVRAVNSVGIGKAANEIVNTPFKIAPPPINLSGTAIGSTAIQLRWKDPKLDNDSILEYIVTYEIVGSPIVQNNSQRLHGYSNTAILTNLLPDKEYEIKVQALTFGGFGAPSIVRVMTGGFCPPGNYSTNGKKPCKKCHYGRYQPLMGQTSCIKCHPGTTTLVKGASSPIQCKDVNID